MADVPGGDAPTFREVLQNKLITTSNLIQNQPNGLDNEYVIEMVEDLLKNVVTLDSVERVSETVYRCLFEAHDILLQNTNSVHSVASTSVAYNGGIGRPCYDIPKDQLEFLLECNFKIEDISNMFGVSKRTIERRMTGFGICKKDKFSSLTEEELDI